MGYDTIQARYILLWNDSIRFDTIRFELVPVGYNSFFHVDIHFLLYISIRKFYESGMAYLQIS